MIWWYPYFRKPPYMKYVGYHDHWLDRKFLREPQQHARTKHYTPKLEWIVSNCENRFAVRLCHFVLLVSSQ